MEIKDFPGYYKPGDVKTHKMTEEEREQYEAERERRLKKYPWRGVKKANRDLNDCAIQGSHTGKRRKK